VRLGLEGMLFLVVFAPVLMLGTARVAEEFQPIWNIAGLGRMFGRRSGARKAG